MVLEFMIGWKTLENRNRKSVFFFLFFFLQLHRIFFSTFWPNQTPLRENKRPYLRSADRGAVFRSGSLQFKVERKGHTQWSFGHVSLIFKVIPNGNLFLGKFLSFWWYHFACSCTVQYILIVVHSDLLVVIAFLRIWWFLWLTVVFLLIS